MEPSSPPVLSAARSLSRSSSPASPPPACRRRPRAAADASTAVTFSSDIAPIVYRRCAECHRAGDIAPMSLMTYDEVRPWAKSIKKAVVSGEMPPWDASPAVGHFKNDISLRQGRDRQDRRLGRCRRARGRSGRAAAAAHVPLGLAVGRARRDRRAAVVRRGGSGRGSVPLDLRRARQHRDQVRARGRAPHRRPPRAPSHGAVPGPVRDDPGHRRHALAREPQEPAGGHAEAALRVGGGIAADRVPRGHGPRAQRQPGADAQHALPPERQSRHRHLEARPLLRRQGAGEGVPDGRRHQAVAADPGELERHHRHRVLPLPSRQPGALVPAAHAPARLGRQVHLPLPRRARRGGARRAAVQLRLAVDLSARPSPRTFRPARCSRSTRGGTTPTPTRAIRTPTSISRSAKEPTTRCWSASSTSW